MKIFIRILPIILCSLLMTAHLFRANIIILPFICLLFPFLLFWKTKTSAILLQLSLFLFGLEWIKTMLFLINIRIASGEN
ncbi:MAG: hypothetical protein WCO13_14060, partial [Bacteroidota bacterium]